MSLGGCAWLDARQRELALRPTPGRPAGYSDEAAGWRAGDQRSLLPVAGSTAAGAGEQVAMWWLPHADPQAPVLLYLHGTFRNLYGNMPKITALRDAGFSVLAVDYRGWGDSTAIIPSEASIRADADLAWAELQKRQPDPGRRVIYGHSMGSAVAVALASRLHGGSDYGALVLESAFTKMPDVAAASGFWGRIGATLTTLEFDSKARIAAVDAPVLMLHGSADTTVPVQLGRQLRDAAAATTTVRWVEVPDGTHSRLHSQAPEVYRQAMQDLIQQLPNAGTAPAYPGHTPP